MKRLLQIFIIAVLLGLPVGCSKSFNIPTSPTVTQTYSYLSQWGSSGSGNGKFNTITGVVVDSSGNVYVADNGNTRVQKFTSTGTYLTQWGSYGTGVGQFKNPIAIGIDFSNNFY